MVFDLLFLRTRSFMAAALKVRRQALTDVCAQFPLQCLLLSEGLGQYGCALFAQVLSLGLEGIMAKRLDSPYLPGKRSRCWLKIKPALSRIHPFSATVYEPQRW